MNASAKYSSERIIWLHTWSPGLMSFRVSRPASFRFTPGQFARLGVSRIDESGTERMVWRAYSVASAADRDYLEFFSVIIPQGDFTSKLAQMSVGDPIFVELTSYGFLTTERLAVGGSLWMLSTGTGLAPFLSMLWDRRNWEVYEQLIVVHSTRFVRDLAYRDVIDGFRLHPHYATLGAKIRYIPIVTREHPDDMLDARVPLLIEDGRLERAAQQPFDAEHSRILLCGNPEMVREIRKLATLRGFQTSRRGQLGTMAVENYW